MNRIISLLIALGCLFGSAYFLVVAEDLTTGLFFGIAALFNQQIALSRD